MDASRRKGKVTTAITLVIFGIMVGAGVYSFCLSQNEEPEIRIVWALFALMWVAAFGEALEKYPPGNSQGMATTGKTIKITALIGAVAGFVILLAIY